MCTRCEELEEKIIQLEKALYGRRWAAPIEFNLCVQEERFLAALVAHPGVRCHELLCDALEPSSAEDVARLVTVIACKVRRKLKPCGIQITPHYRRGYSLSETDRQRLLNWPTQHTEAA